MRAAVYHQLAFIGGGASTAQVEVKKSIAWMCSLSASLYLPQHCTELLRWSIVGLGQFRHKVQVFQKAHANKLM